MKANFIYSLVITLGLFFAGSSFNVVYSQKPHKSAEKATPAKECVVKYTCVMHPKVMMDKPGKCPQCGMKLVEKKIEAKEGVPQKMKSTKPQKGQKEGLPGPLPHSKQL